LGFTLLKPSTVLIHPESEAILYTSQFYFVLTHAGFPEGEYGTVGLDLRGLFKPK